MKIIKKLVAVAGILSLSVTAMAQMTAPSFSLKDADGKTHTMDQYKGKLLVLEFTNPGNPVTGRGGCPFVVPRYEQKIMQNLAQQVQAAGGVYLAVNSGHYNTPEDSKAIAAKYGVTYPTLQDTSGTLARALQAKTTPHMYVIDKEGKIVYNGALNDNNSTDVAGDATATNYVMQAVEAVNAGRAPEVAQTRSYGCNIHLKE